MDIASTYKEKVFWKAHSLKMSEMGNIIEIHITEIIYVLGWTGLRSYLIFYFKFYYWKVCIGLMFMTIHTYTRINHLHEAEPFLSANNRSARQENFSLLFLIQIFFVVITRASQWHTSPELDKSSPRAETMPLILSSNLRLEFLSGLSPLSSLVRCVFPTSAPRLHYVTKFGEGYKLWSFSYAVFSNLPVIPLSWVDIFSSAHCSHTQSIGFP
jgi:asparagine N-glycosylation enzyme membrane subunit Stt3